MKRITWLKMLAILLAAGAILPLLGHALLLPLIARDRINAVLHAAGFRSVTFNLSRASLWGIEVRDLSVDGSSAANVLIEYEPQGLWQSRLKSITVTGAVLVVDPTYRLPARTQQTDDAPFQLPLDRMEIRHSAIVLSGERIPFETDLIAHQQQPYEFKSTLTIEGKPLDITATFDPAQTTLTGTMHSDAIAGKTVAAIYNLLRPQSPLSVDGSVAFDGSFNWSRNGTSFNATVEPADIWLSLPGPTETNLGWFAGVLSVEGNVRGPTAAVTIAMDELEFESESAEMEIEGLTGHIELTSLSPLATADVQHLKVDRFRSGEAIFRDGIIDFAIDPSGSMLVEHTQWKWLDGTLSADGVRYHPASKSFEMTVQARQIQLKKLLELFAEEYATGEGRIDLRLPVKVSGNRIFFGDGNITGVGGGTIEIIDADAVADSIGQSADSRDANVRNKIVEALRDFEYDILTGTLVPDPERGLLTNLHIKGRGTRGARQSLDFELRVDGLDDAILLYFGLRQHLAVN